MNYNYWNDFIDKWKKMSPSQFTSTSQNFYKQFGWTNPNMIPLLNFGIQDYSLKYLPEPWWGNSGSNIILNSVVVNFNPGQAECIKLHNFSHNLYGFNDFMSFVNSESLGLTTFFPNTNRWHKRNRSTRVFNTLKRLKTNLNGHEDLQNHLSIELIPWHTTNVRKIGLYIKGNLNAIFDNSLSFAADQSRRIQNSLLNRKVIVRMSGNVTLDLLNQLGTINIQSNIIIPQDYTKNHLLNGIGGYMKFKFNKFQDVDFICIWGTGRTGNDFPPNQDMDWIFQNII